MQDQQTQIIQGIHRYNYVTKYICTSKHMLSCLFVLVAVGSDGFTLPPTGSMASFCLHMDTKPHVFVFAIFPLSEIYMDPKIIILCDTLQHSIA